MDRDHEGVAFRLGHDLTFPRHTLLFNALANPNDEEQIETMTVFLA